jgi:excinuclease ABC subunit B
VELAVADDPLAKQADVEKAVVDAKTASGRSTGGRGGMRGGNAGRRGKR